jgi:hypothetical protein
VLTDTYGNLPSSFLSFQLIVIFEISIVGDVFNDTISNSLILVSTEPSVLPLSLAVISTL